MAETLDLKRSASQILSPVSPSEIEENESRGEQILECQRQIKFWQDKLKILQQEQNRSFRMAKLRMFAKSIWSQLSSEEKETKEILLAALESKELPYELSGSRDWDRSVMFRDDGSNEGWQIPQSLVEDRDVCLARARRKETWQQLPLIPPNQLPEIDSIIPPSLRDDKEIMLAAFKCEPTVIRLMSKELKADMDMFKAYLGHEKISGDYLRYFCEEFRSNEELILKVCSHPGITINFLNHCSKPLISDKRFFLRAIEAIISSGRDPKTLEHYTFRPECILEYAPEHLQDDDEIVMSCLRHSGLNLQYASHRLRQNDEVVAAACAQDTDAYRFKRFKGDEEVVERLSSIKTADWAMIPKRFRSNLEFVALAIYWTSGKIWASLPLEMKSKVQVASAIIGDCSCVSDPKRNAVLEALRLCPQVLSDRTAMKNMITNYVRGIAEFEWLLERSQIDIRNDNGLMLQAVKRKSKYWQYCSEEIRNDTKIICELVKSGPLAFEIVGEAFLSNHPELAIRVFETPSDMQSQIFDLMGFWHNNVNLGRDLPEACSLNHDVAMAYLRRGGQPRSIPTILRCNKEFVLKAMSINLDILHWVGRDLVRDPDIALGAISNDARAINYYLERNEMERAYFEREEVEVEGGQEFLISFAKTIRSRLQTYKTFQNEVVGQMALPPAAKKRRTLSMLNQGPVMLSTYTDRISEYLGVLQTEEDYQKHRKASNHLAVWGL